MTSSAPSSQPHPQRIAAGRVEEMRLGRIELGKDAVAGGFDVHISDAGAIRLLGKPLHDGCFEVYGFEFGFQSCLALNHHQGASEVC